MNEIVNLVMERAGITQEQAQQAVDTVIGFFKDKLSMGEQLDDLLKGFTGGSSDTSDTLKNIGEGFGDLPNSASREMGENV
jgi:hypothetical protein